MAEWHLHDLEHALTQHGWRTTDADETPGDREWGISGSWELARGASKLVLEFEGGDADGVITYPIVRAYACHVRGREGLSIYFRRRSNPAWRQELDAFVTSLDDLTGRLEPHSGVLAYRSLLLSVAEEERPPSHIKP
jgi:hypothetical protein